MPQSDPDLFDQENLALFAAREVHDNNAGDAASYRAALGELINCYERLLRETRRLIRRSDREEFEMNQLNSRLNELASELEYRATHDSLTNTLNRGAVIARANQLAEQMRATIADWNFSLPGAHQITASFGVSWTPAGADFSIAYGAADEALYKAKHSGRNCVMRAD